MKSFFSSSDGLEMEAVMDMLAGAGIRYELRSDPRSQTYAQLCVEDNDDFSKATAMLTACRGATR